MLHSLRNPLALISILFAFLASSANAQDDKFTGLGLSTGYLSGWFAPYEKELDDVRVDQQGTASYYTTAITNKYLLRAGAALVGTDAGLFFTEWGWRISPDTAFFIGPSVKYLDEGSVEGYEGTAFALGVSGSIDFEADPLPETAAGVSYQLVFGVQGTTRDLTHVETGIETGGLAIGLGIGAAANLFK